MKVDQTLGAYWRYIFCPFQARVPQNTYRSCSKSSPDGDIFSCFSGGCGFHSQWVMSRCKCPITSLLPGHTWTCRCHGRWDRTQQKDLFPRYFRMFLDCGAYASSTEVNDSVRKSVLNILTILFVSSPLHSSLSSPDGAACQCALAPPTRRWFYAQWRVFNLGYFVY